MRRGSHRALEARITEGLEKAGVSASIGIAVRGATTDFRVRGAKPTKRVRQQAPAQERRASARRLGAARGDRLRDALGFRDRV